MPVEQMVGFCWNKRSDAVEYALSLVPLQHPPGHAQEDFGETSVVIGGEPTRPLPGTITTVEETHRDFGPLRLKGSDALS